MSTAEPNGVLLIHKQAGMTSHDVVSAVRRLYHTRRVGHTGTLDPMATGVLVVLIGRAAKAAEYLTGHEKTYRAELKLGITTDTEDVTGNLLSSAEYIPDAAQVIATAQSFVGEIMQIPPMYSALKLGGKKLVDLARKGIEIIAPSGKFCTAIPIERASAPAVEITASPARSPAYTAPTAIPSGRL